MASPYNFELRCLGDSSQKDFLRASGLRNRINEQNERASLETHLLLKQQQEELRAERQRCASNAFINERCSTLENYNPVESFGPGACAPAHCYASKVWRDISSYEIYDPSDVNLTKLNAATTFTDRLNKSAIEIEESRRQKNDDMHVFRKEEVNRDELYNPRGRGGWTYTRNPHYPDDNKPRYSAYIAEQEFLAANKHGYHPFLYDPCE